MEIWDVTDQFGNIIGQCVRGTELAPGTYHGIADIWVMNSEGKLLVTQRDKNKSYPLFWENTAGSLLQGETFTAGAVRELKEETGLNTKEEELLLLERRRERRSIWESFFTTTKEETAICLQAGETVDYRWVTVEELDKMMNRGELASPVIYRYMRVRSALLQAMKTAR